MQTGRRWRTLRAMSRPNEIPLTELRRPDLVLEQVQERCPFTAPKAVLARVDGPYDSQQVTDAAHLWWSPPVFQDDGSALVTAAAEQLGLLDADGPYRERPLLVPVVVRPGSCWWGFDELEVMLAIRYANLWVRQGGPLTVTAKGWYEPLDGASGTHPRARWDDPLAAR